MYSDKQIEAIKNELQRKFIGGEVKGYEMVVALFSMEQMGKIKKTDIRDILMYVFMNNVKGVLRALDTAKEVMDKELIDAIIKDVKSNS